MLTEEYMGFAESGPVPKHNDPEAIKDLKLRRPTTVAGGSAAMETRQRCVIRVAGSGIPASRADTERRRNAWSKSERAVDPDERVP